MTRDWSIKDIVAHLTTWRRRTVGRLRAAQDGEPVAAPPWSPDLQTDDEINAWIFESNHARSLRDVLEESDRVFRELVTAIEGLSDEAFENIKHAPWLEGEPLTAGRFFAHFHQEHEPDMRAWLAQVEKQ